MSNESFVALLPVLTVLDPALLGNVILYLLAYTALQLGHEL